MSYCADKLVIDGQTHAHTYTRAGNDNTRRPKLAMLNHGWIVLKFGTHIAIDSASELINFSRIWLKGHGHSLTQCNAFGHLVHFGQNCKGVEKNKTTSYQTKNIIHDFFGWCLNTKALTCFCGSQEKQFFYDLQTGHMYQTCFKQIWNL